MAHRTVKDLVTSESVTLSELQAAVLRGCPDSLRGVCWKLLLGYLPLPLEDRSAAVARRRADYPGYVQDANYAPGASAASAAASMPQPATPGALSTSLDNLFGSPSKVGRLRPSQGDLDSLLSSLPALEGEGGGEGIESLPRLRLAQPSPPQQGGEEGTPPPPPPLSPADLEHENAHLRREIEMDVERTQAELSFFQQRQHTEAMARILFVYAKLNRGVRYIQGMNELLAPLLYVCVTEGTSSGGGSASSSCGVATPASLEHAEADAFFLFCALMSRHGNVFIQEQDGDASGIKGKLRAFELALGRREPAIARHLEALSLPPIFYALGWLTTLYSQELNLHDTMMLWDKLLADSPTFSFLTPFCVACLRLQRSRLLQADFAAAMKMLRTPPPVDFDVLLSAAMAVRAEDAEAGAPGSPSAAMQEHSGHAAQGGGSGGGSSSAGAARGEAFGSSAADTLSGLVNSAGSVWTSLWGSGGGK